MRKYLLIIAAGTIAFSSFSQQITKQDYARAVSFMWQNLQNKKVFNISVRPNWFADSSGFSFSTQNKNGITYNKLYFNKPTIEPLFDHERLAKLLSDSLKTAIKSNELHLNSISHIDKTKMSFTVNDKTFILYLTNYSFLRDNIIRENEMESKSPDGKWVAYTDKYNLFIKSVSTGEVKQLSTEGKKNYEYASYYSWDDIIVGESGERPRRFFVSWSPDSKWIYTNICDFNRGQKMYLLDWSVDTLYKPKLLSYYRASPGDTDMIYETPVFFNVESGKEFVKNEYKAVWGHAPTFEWSKESGVVYGETHFRGDQQIEIERLDLNKQSKELLYRETSTTNIDAFQKRLVEEWGKMIIVSEKDGWRQVYLLDIKDKSVKPVTNGSFYVNDFEIDQKGKSIIFTASGKESNSNPYYQHGYKTGIDGKGLILLTPENANHEFVVSPDGKYIVDNVSAPDQPTKTLLRETKTGKTNSKLSNGEISDLTAMA